MDKYKETAALDLTELDSVSGGSGGDYIHDLSCFIHKTVCNVICYDDTSGLTMRNSPGGDIIPGICWRNGDAIMVHGQYSEDGWSFAYESGKYGYVDSKYVL